MKYKIIILILILSIGTHNILSGETPGRTSAQFLKISPSPRAVSMGNAYCSMSEDADSLYYNPGTISFIKNMDFSVSYAKWLQAMNYMSLFGVLPVQKVGTFGIGVFGLYDSDILRTTMDDFGNIEKTGKVTAGDYCFMGSYARNILKDFSAGINLKGIYQKLDDISSFSFAGDIGVFYVFEKYNLKTGLTVQNIGSKTKFVKDEFDLPLNFRLGANYTYPFDKKNKLMVIAEGQKTVYESFAVGMGLEYAYNNMIFIRTGYEYQNKSDSRGIKAGCGFIIKNIKINYGFDLFNYLGTTHFIQVNIPIELAKKVVMGEEEVVSTEEQDILDSADDYILNNEYENALPAYLKVMQIDKNHTRAAYNIACIYAFLNDLNKSTPWLDYTLKLDSTPAMLERIKTDEDFDSIRETQAFKSIIEKYTVKPVK